MRAGRLKTRRYKVRRHGGWAALCILLLLFGFALHRGWIALRLPALLPGPDAAATPAPDPQSERTLTLPGQSWYALQLGAFDELSAAQALAEAYQGRGAGGYLLQTDACRVLAAAYPSREEAQAVQSRLKTQYQVDTVIVEIARPEITLRLTGPGSQLTALEDAFDAALKLSEHLSALSQALDQGDADTEAVYAALRSEQTTAQALLPPLETLYLSSGHRAVGDLCAILRNAEEALSSCLSAGGKTQLGARIKYCQLLCLCRMAACAEALAR